MKIQTRKIIFPKYQMAKKVQTLNHVQDHIVTGIYGCYRTETFCLLIEQTILQSLKHHIVRKEKTTHDRDIILGGHEVVQVLVMTFR